MREAHCGGINGWIVGKKRIDLGFHVIIGRNDVQEILDDAKTEIGLALVDWNCNPRLSHSPLSNVQGLIERGARLEYMVLLRCCQKRIKISAESVIANVTKIILSSCRILNEKSTGLQQRYQLCW